MSKCRIIINSWDDRSFNQIINRPLAELIETTEETGECLCVYNNNIQSFIDRVWECPKCHTVHDRDLLASQNIKNIAFSDLNQKYHNSGLGKSVELVEVLA